MTKYAYNSSASGATSVTATQANVALQLTWSSAGDDIIHGGAGNDSVHGGSDSDTLAGGTGNDFPHGGEGVDFLDLSDATAGVHFDLADGPMTINEGGLGSDTIEGFEALILSAFADIVNTNAHTFDHHA